MDPVDRPERDGDAHRVHRMQPEGEGGDDAEVPATAAQRPEQVGVGDAVRPHRRAVRQDHVRGQQIVDRQAVLAGEVAVAAAEGEAADAGGRQDSGGGGQPERVGGVVEVAERGAAADRGRPRGGVDVRPAHGREVDGDAVVHQAQARTAVAAAADREREARVPYEADGGHDVRRVGAPHHRRRPFVDHGVVDGAGLAVLRVPRADDGTAQRRPHRVQGFERDAVHGRAISSYIEMGTVPARPPAVADVSSLPAVLARCQSAGPRGGRHTRRGAGGAGVRPGASSSPAGTPRP